MSLLTAIRRRVDIARAAAVRATDESEGIAVCECNAWKGYMVEVMCPRAIRVELRPGDCAERVLAALPRAARAVVIQIDASLTIDFLADEPLFRAALAARGVATLNADATDIRKRTIHTLCAALDLACARTDRAGPPGERVIVKTTLNFGGMPERELLRRWRASATRFAAELSDFIPGPLGYRICRRADVPAAAWDDPSLVVERFIENPEGVFFRVYVVGPASVVSMAWSDYHIKKLSLPLRARRDFYYWTSGNEHTALGPSTAVATRALTLIRRLCPELGLDLCGADCVVDADGTVIPIDVNKTPYWGEPRISPILEHLRRGFDYLIAARR